MVKSSFRTSLLCLGLMGSLPVVAHAQTSTPVGAARLLVDMGPSFGCPAMWSSVVLTHWQVKVGPDSTAGTVRPVFDSVVGDPVILPAQAGTYTFPAPRFAWQGCGDPGLIQETGGHAILTPEDSIFHRSVVVQREGLTETRIEGQRLTVTGITEPDGDADLLGDTTEDRTDLTLTGVPERDAIGRVKVTLTVTNAGPLSADAPVVTAKREGRWEPSCGSARPAGQCGLQPIAPGTSRTVTYFEDAPATSSLAFSVRSEGSDLNAVNNHADFTFGPAQALDLKADAKQRLSSGVKVNLLAAKARSARVTVAVKIRGKRVSLARTVRLTALKGRDLTIHPSGATLRSLRRALDKGSLKAQITVRTPGLNDAVTVSTTLTR